MADEHGYFNPFPGLRAFEEEEDVLFFGREKQVDELLTKLRTVRFLAVIGSSGSGKSSLVKSGLIPALHSGFMSGAGSDWRICSFRPGSNPIGNLAAAVSENGILYNDLDADQQSTFTAINEATLRRSNRGLLEVFKQSHLSPKSNLLILVDQFEELFRFSRFEKEAGEGKRDSAAFINLLLTAVEEKTFPVYVVFTMRSDFLGDCTEFRGLPEAINKGQYLVPRMTREERREAITGPVAVGGAQISQRLLNQLLNDVGDNPDQLPILQHALMRTWEVWYKKPGSADKEIDIDDYEATGTMRSALSQHAEEAYQELDSPRKKQICEQIFKALTDKGSDARGIRRPQTLAALALLANASVEEVAEVVEVFRQKGRTFLMPPAGNALTPSSIIDISHESIMRVWERLMSWVEEENQSAQIYLRLCEAAGRYETGKGGLWRDPELQLAWKWKEQNEPNSAWASRYNNEFDKAMVFLLHSKKQYEAEMQQKELRQKTRLKRARMIAAVIGCIAFIAFLVSIYAFQQKNIATRQTIVAEEKTKEANRQKSLAEESRKNALTQKQIAEEKSVEALQQKEIAESEKRKALSSEQNAIVQKQLAEQQKNFAERQKHIAEQNEKLARDQKRIAEQQTELAVKNEKIAQSEKQVSTRLKELAEARNLAYVSLLKLNENKPEESRKLALDAYRLNATNSGPVQNSDVYTALHFNWISNIANANQLNAHTSPVRCLEVNKANNTILSGDENGNIILSTIESDGRLVAKGAYALKEEVRSLAASSGGMVVVSTSRGSGYLFDQNNFSLNKKASFGFPGIARKSGFITTNAWYVLSSKGLFVYEWQGGTVKTVTSFNNDSIGSVEFSLAGKCFLAIGNRLMVYSGIDNIGLAPEEQFTMSSTIRSLRYSGAEDVIAAGSYDGSIWLKKMGQRSAFLRLPLHQSSVNDMSFHTVGNRLQLATAGADQTVRLIDVSDVLANDKKEDVLTLKGHLKWVYQVEYSGDGKYLISCGEDKKLIVWHSSAADLFNALQTSK